MIVHIPSPLRSYTGRADQVAASGRTVADVLTTLDRSYPGFRFRIINEQDRIRPHIKIFVNENLIRDLATPLAEQDRVHIICALSGG